MQKELIAASHLLGYHASALTSCSGRGSKLVEMLLDKAMLLTNDLKIAHDCPEGTWIQK